MSKHNSIMGMTGINTNPLSNRPVTIENLKKEKQRLERFQSDANALISDLAGEGGVIVKEIISKLISRVKNLIAEDPDCKIYMNILKSIELKIDLAASEIVNAKLNKVISKLGGEA